MRDLSEPPKIISYEENYKYQISALNKQLYEAYKRIEELQRELKRIKNGKD